MLVPIVGMGLVSGFGVGKDAISFDGDIKKSAVSAVNGFGYANSEPNRNVIKVPSFDPESIMGKSGLKFLSHGSKLLLVAAKDALSGIEDEFMPIPEKFGIIVGTNFAGLEVIAEYDKTIITDGPEAVGVMESPHTLCNSSASHVPLWFKAHAVNMTISSGNNSSIDAIGFAASYLKNNKAQTVLTGGVEEINNYTLWQANGIYEPADIPMGEAAALILLDVRNKIGALAYINSWSTKFAQEGRQHELIRDVCLDALERSNLKAKDIKLLINGAHSADMNGSLSGIDSVFNGAGSDFQLPVLSMKPMVGETHGAAGALHVVVAVRAFQERMLPPFCKDENIQFPPYMRFREHSEPWTPGPVLILEKDPLGGASALIITPS